MKQYLTCIWLFAFSLLVQELKGQNIQVDSLIVTPQNPTKKDSILIRLYTIVAFKSKKLYSDYHIASDTITLKACYTISGATSVSFFSDTFAIGKLQEGKYIVNFIGYISLDTNVCNNLMDSVNYVDSFIVKPPDNIIYINEILSSIYPNPTHDELNILVQRDLNIIAIQIRDMQGRILQQYNNVSTPLSVSALPNGVYLLYIETDKGRVINRILKE